MGDLEVPSPSPAPAPGDDPGAGPTGPAAALLRRWAADTWRGLTALDCDGLPADRIGVSLRPSTRVAQTSPTNAAAWLWSVVAAAELRLCSRREAATRIAATLSRLATLPRHAPSGLFANWYDPASGALLATRPSTRTRIARFVSTVDNAWLALALHLVASADPGGVGPTATALLDGMRLDAAFDPAARPGGLFHGGFSLDPPPARYRAVRGNHLGRGPDVWYTAHHYDLLVTEARIATYVGIARGHLPAAAYFAPWRSRFGVLDRAAGDHHARHEGLDVPEGAVPYGGMRLVPSWGGSMFEDLMPNLFVPESAWGPTSWAVQHPLWVAAHAEHGLRRHGWPVWGFSPAADPTSRTGYREYGVADLGLHPTGYPSDVEGARRRARRPGEAALDAGDGVVTPHASFLALPVAADAAIDNLTRLETDLGAYGPGGFVDSVAVRSGRRAARYLCLDQAMTLAALAGALADDAIRRHVATPDVQRVLRPLLAAETFAARAHPADQPMTAR